MQILRYEFLYSSGLDIFWTFTHVIFYILKNNCLILYQHEIRAILALIALGLFKVLIPSRLGYYTQGHRGNKK